MQEGVFLFGLVVLGMFFRRKMHGGTAVPLVSWDCCMGFFVVAD